jgi:hypothetical protein
MRVFKSKPFARFAKRNNLRDAGLCAAIVEANRGLIAANLGGGLIKQRIAQRIARQGGGKSGGFRTILAYRWKGLAVFLHGFAKNEAENISRDDLAALKKLAAVLLAFGADDFSEAVASGALIEVRCNGKNEAIS